MSTTTLLLLVIIGLAAGFLSGLVGIGGGIIMVPALVLVLGFTQKQAQGTSLGVLVLPVVALAVWQYYKQGQITSFRTAYFAARAERLSIPVGCNSAFPVIMIMMSCEDWLLWQSGLLLRVPSLIWRY